MSEDRRKIIDNLKSNSVIIIAGPTASGKSGLALEIAQECGGIIVNADSMQVYRGISIVAATPDDEDKKKAEHRLYEIYEPSVRGSVADWLNLAVEEIRNIHKKQKVPIVVGGTGFYIDSLVNGCSPIPETKNEIKQQVEDLMKNNKPEDVYAYLQKIDEAGAKKVNCNDTTRIRRALEIKLDTGKSITEWFTKPFVKLLNDVDFRIIKLLPDIKELEKKCSQRFDIMMEKGALAEVEILLSKNLDDSLPAMKAIGVPELGGYLKGKISLSEAVEKAKLHTRQYAKRQLTWFRHHLS